MPAPRYLHIGDEGSVCSAEDETTAQDLEFAAVGMRTIVRLDELSYYGRERQWRPIPAGRLVSAGLEGEREKRFHESLSSAGG